LKPTLDELKIKNLQNIMTIHLPGRNTQNLHSTGLASQTLT
jgi:hypothetical protein